MDLGLLGIVEIPKMVPSGVELSTGTKLRAKQTSYFLGTENVNRISLKINLLVHRKDPEKV